MYSKKMVDLNCKSNIVSPATDNMPNRSPRPPTSNSNKPSTTNVSVVSPSPAPESDCSAYENYIRLPEMTELWNRNEFLDWKNEVVLKPALHALEFTFRFVSVVLSDPRPYTNQKEWKRRLESLATTQIELISMFCEDDNEIEKVPLVDIGQNGGVLTREGSSAEIWKLSEREETNVLVTQISEESLLPRLATWRKSEDVADKIMYTIECHMRRCPYTLGLGEPNLNGKPSLNFDAVCKPAELHSLTKTPPDHANVNNYENKTLFATHQILESWIRVGHELLKRVELEIDSNQFEKASNDIYIMEKIWKLLTEIQDLHLLMDPDDFLKLKHQLDIKTTSASEPLCFRSIALVEITKRSKNLRHKVPYILDVEVDPMGGPRVQEAAMKLYNKKHDVAKIHLLQGLQAVEGAVKKFYYSYKQLLVMVMGSVEAKGGLGVVNVDSNDSLAPIFLEPTYFPSLDGAKTFLGDYWKNRGKGSM
uniref:nematode resistance protein-like HSPRO2 n=1 Tax=Erigeron canadensis TaxID=72917 RepID=UPI001CB9C1E8|nr:nematode resistance protein-like HSPRO2 [Erigeron canadensis]